MSFVSDLAFNDQRALEQDAAENPATAAPDPGFWDGGLDAIGTGFARGSFEAAATVQAGFNNLWISGLDVAASVLLPEPRGGGTPSVTEAERTFRADQSAANAEMITSLRPSAETSGLAAQIISEVSAVIPRTVGGFVVAGPVGGAVAAGAPAGYSGEIVAESEGIDPGTARIKGVIDAATYGVGAVLPAARILKSVIPDLAVTTAANVGLGIASRGGTAALLEANGYSQQAQQYKALDSTGLMVDAVLGTAFWGVGRGFRPKTSDVDAGLAANNGLHHQNGTAPGTPIDPRSSVAHQNALDQAISQLSRGEPVNVGSLVAKLEAGDRARLERAGITEQDWAVWRAAQPEDWRGAGDTVLTAGSIYRLTDAELAGASTQFGVSPQRLRDQAATRLLGTVLDETAMAIPAPGARERAFMHGNNKRGEWGGEIMRSFWQFKSFSISMISKHFRRALAQQTGWGKAGYMASLFATTTVLGGIALQLNEIVSGRDPKNMLDDGLGGVPGLRFGMAAMLKGGALSLYGDFLFSNTTQGGTSALAAFGGPLAGDVEAVLNLRGQTANAVEKEDGSAVGASLVRLAKGHIPGANLWYTKAATDHLIFHQMQEYFSPGYLNRMQRRAQREFGQSYWWEPDELTPDRAPDLGAAFGD